MAKTLRTVALMLLAPPLLLLLFAQAGLFGHSAALNYALMAASWAAGMAALLTSGWGIEARCGVGAAYLAAIPVLPFLALLAVCTTGDCL